MTAEQTALSPGQFPLESIDLAAQGSELLLPVVSIDVVRALPNLLFMFVDPPQDASAASDGQTIVTGSTR